MNNQNGTDCATEDAKMIAENILSGMNACGALRKAVETGDADYFARAALSVLAGRHAELEQARTDMLARAERATTLEYALEFVAQNIGGAVTIREPGIIAEIAKALGRKI